MVQADGIRHVFEQSRFSRLGLRHNHAPLPLANGGKQIHESGAHGAACCAEFEALLREQGRQELEGHTVFNPLRTPSIDALDVNHWVVFLTNPRRANARHHGVACLKTKLLQLFGRDVHVVR